MPIDVAEFGIDKDVNPLHPQKEEAPINVTVAGILVLLQPTIRALVAETIIALQLSLESYLVFWGETIIEDKPEQFLKAPVPIEFNELPIFNDVKPLHPLNAYCPILVTEFGIDKDVKPLQLENALSSIDVTELGIVTDVKHSQL